MRDPTIDLMHLSIVRNFGRWCVFVSLEFLVYNMINCHCAVTMDWLLFFWGHSEYAVFCGFHMLNTLWWWPWCIHGISPHPFFFYCDVAVINSAVTAEWKLVNAYKYYICQTTTSWRQLFQKILSPLPEGTFFLPTPSIDINLIDIQFPIYPTTHRNILKGAFLCGDILFSGTAQTQSCICLSLENNRLAETRFIDFSK